ncbi:hypothetical protein BD324DRAFT_632748 [Kockovaella imperatae]|uniref:Zn(2)-C6 fungal-type domain-containing protein n=1 Tax=Kockovaella imperatae TaxID=4999 RepID=A0A1Y1UD10_9TREE|nr:hypothetical protein BD324DRAFT_632748 [Kockovaella imperatae]ORX35414.1 hypothetical protein BD324DRAFT_632748 [Kockovaella imperatae]
MICDMNTSPTEQGSEAGPSKRVVTRACDLCHERKVKCDGQLPCRTCLRGPDLCTYANVPRKKGPKRKKTNEGDQIPPGTEDPYDWFKQDAIVDPSFTVPTPSQYGVPYAGYPTSLSWPDTGPSHPSPLAMTMLETTIIPLLHTFYERIYRMMPIFPAIHIFGSIPSASHEYHFISDRTRDPCFIALILSMAALASIHPLQQHEMAAKPDRVRQAIGLLEEAERLQHQKIPTLELILTKYLGFATWGELQRGDLSSAKLSETLELATSLHLDSFDRMGDEESTRRYQTMHHVLALTEIVSAIFNPVKINAINLRCLSPGVLALYDCRLSRHLQCLASLFSNLDDSIFYCWTQQCPTHERKMCHRLDRARVLTLLRDLSQPPHIVLTEEIDLLSESERADVVVTWQWLRNRVWTLAHAHRLTHRANDLELMLSAPELSTDYPVDVALTTVELCRALSFASMETHGRGFVEKLYNIAATPTGLLVDDHQALHGKLADMAKTEQWSEMIKALHHFVSRHRQGADLAMPLGLALSVGPALAPAVAV